MKTKAIKDINEISNYNYKSRNNIIEKKVSETRKLLEGVDLNILFDSKKIKI